MKVIYNGKYVLVNVKKITIKKGIE